MINNIGGFRFPQAIEQISTGNKTSGSDSSSFGKIFESAVDRVQHLQDDTQSKVDKLLNGEDQEVHEVVLAGQRSELAFEYFMQVRNKVVSAYQEVMRMQM